MRSSLPTAATDSSLVTSIDAATPTSLCELSRQPTASTVSARHAAAAATIDGRTRYRRWGWLRWTRVGGLIGATLSVAIDSSGSAIEYAREIGATTSVTMRLRGLERWRSRPLRA